MFLINNRNLRWLLLAAATAAVLWLWQQQGSTESPKEESAAGADYSLRDATLSQYQEDGSPRYVIAADTIEHLPTTAVYELETLQLDWLPGTQNRWVMDATRGEMDDSRSELLLYDGIIAKHKAKSGLVTVITETLTIMPDEQKATTKQHVEIESTLGRISGASADIDLSSDLVQLYGGVQGTYAAR